MANMARILLALRGYQDVFATLPPGVVNPDGPIENQPQGLHQGWLIQTLPYLDQQTLYDQVDLTVSVYDPPNVELLAERPAGLVCPSQPTDVPGATNYAGCHNDTEAPIARDNLGLLFLDSRIGQDEVPDGFAHTLLVSEKLAFAGDLGWLSGTRATLRNTGHPLNGPLASAPLAAGKNDAGEETVDGRPALLYVGGFASAHPGGANVGFGDASVEFYSDDIDPVVWQHLGNRADTTDASPIEPVLEVPTPRESTTSEN